MALQIPRTQSFKLPGYNWRRGKSAWDKHTWLYIAVIIAVGVLLVVLEASRANDIVDLILDAASWLVGPFEDFFTLVDRKLVVAVNWGLALAAYVVVGRLVTGLLRRPLP